MKGLGASGTWGCFDEFNRLIPEVLSVCTVQFKAVCEGVRQYNPKDEATWDIRVEGDIIRLIPTVGAYITMNPGYLGRSELPEGLKALFRPMTVMVPDLVLICENMLMAQVGDRGVCSVVVCGGLWPPHYNLPTTEPLPPPPNHAPRVSRRPRSSHPSFTLCTPYSKTCSPRSSTTTGASARSSRCSWWPECCSVRRRRA